MDDRVLPVGRVACVTGHRVDEPGAKSARFPEANVPGVARKLKQTIEEYQIQIGFASAASGGDLLFIEAMQAAQAEITVVLPFPALDFIGTSVGQRWRSRFEDALNKLPPDRLITLHEQTPATETGKNEAYARCNEVIQQNAADAARMLSNTALLVAVVVPAGGPIPRGGTQDAIRLWTEKLRGDVIEINPLAP